MFLINSQNRSPFLDIVLKDSEKLLSPGSEPYHNVRNEEALVIYECFFFHEGNWSRRRGNLTVTLNHLEFRSEAFRSNCKWGSVESVRECAWHEDIYAHLVDLAPTALSRTLVNRSKTRVEIIFIDGSRWVLCDFSDTPAAAKFLKTFHALQKKTWGVVRPGGMPFERLLGRCWGECVSRVDEYKVEHSLPPPRMLPARPMMLAPRPYAGNDWLKNLGGKVPDIEAFVASHKGRSGVKTITGNTDFQLADDVSVSSTVDCTPTGR